MLDPYLLVWDPARQTIYSLICSRYNVNMIVLVWIYKFLFSTFTVPILFINEVQGSGSTKQTQVILGSVVCLIEFRDPDPQKGTTKLKSEKLLS